MFPPKLRKQARQCQSTWGMGFPVISLKLLEPHWAKMLRRLTRIRALVSAQAEDDGLWFEAKTAPEAYLQQELRMLHELIEADDDEEVRFRCVGPCWTGDCECRSRDGAWNPVDRPPLHEGCVCVVEPARRPTI